MGYTHYFTFKKTQGTIVQNERRYQLAIKRIKKVVRFYQSQFESGDDRRLSGYTAYSSFYGGVSINGAKCNLNEDFILREHFIQNSGSNICKTARKPYDIVVVASLVILKHYLKDSIEVDSDGDGINWQDGFDLAKTVTGLKSLAIPKTIYRGD